MRRGWCERASVIRPPNETPPVMVATVAFVATEMLQFVVINLCFGIFLLCHHVIERFPF